MSQKTAAPVVSETRQLEMTNLDRFYKLSVIVLVALAVILGCEAA